MRLKKIPHLEPYIYFLALSEIPIFRTSKDNKQIGLVKNRCPDCSTEGSEMTFGQFGSILYFEKSGFHQACSFQSAYSYSHYLS